MGGGGVERVGGEGGGTSATRARRITTRRDGEEGGGDRMTRTTHVARFEDPYDEIRRDGTRRDVPVARDFSTGASRRALVGAFAAGRRPPPPPPPTPTPTPPPTPRLRLRTCAPRHPTSRRRSRRGRDHALPYPPSPSTPPPRSCRLDLSRRLRLRHGWQTIRCHVDMSASTREHRASATRTHRAPGRATSRTRASPRYDRPRTP